MAKSNQLFVTSFALREPCLKLIKGQANNYAALWSCFQIGFFARLMITPGVNKVLFFVRPSPFFSFSIECISWYWVGQLDWKKKN